MFLRHRLCSQRGVTLLELITVMLIVVILALMVMPLAGTVRNRLERTRCTSNLRNIYVATTLYVQDHRSWPQLPPLRSADSTVIAGKWIDTLKPYSLEQSSWICPTIQKMLGAPDLSKPENTRVDYFAMPFDSNPTTPTRWSNMPWFIESANAHGNGQLLIFSDGHTDEMYNIRNQLPTKPGLSR